MWLENIAGSSSNVAGSSETVTVRIDVIGKVGKSIWPLLAEAKNSESPERTALSLLFCVFVNKLGNILY